MQNSKSGLRRGAGAAVFLSLAAAASCASPQRPADFHVSADGVQVYRLEGEAWKLVGVRANLTDDAGRPVGTHYKTPDGPAWEIGADRIVATKKWERASPNPASIPELLLSARPEDAHGVFEGVHVIERLDTHGGVAPPPGEAARPGEERESPYKAEYWFLTAPR